METIPRFKRYLIYVAMTGVCYPIIKYVFVPNHRCPSKNSNRTVVVTGASGNLGAEVVKQFASRRFRIIMACRDLDKCKSIRRQIVLETANRSIACRHLDLEDVNSINAFVDNISQSEPHIDILINNAAVKNVETKELTKYGVEKNYWVNYVAPFLLTMRLLPKLEESARITKDSRIVNVTGWPKRRWNVHLDDINFNTRGYDGKLAYRQSKLALAYFTILLDKFNRDKKNSVYVYAADPCFQRVQESLFRPTTTWESFYPFFENYFALAPEMAVGNIMRGALEEVADDSGRVYSLFGNVWRWGKKGPISDMMKAGYVWNSAAEILLKISDDPKLDIKSNPCDQEKLQAGNNSVGSVAEGSVLTGKVSA